MSSTHECAARLLRHQGYTRISFCARLLVHEIMALASSQKPGHRVSADPAVLAQTLGGWQAPAIEAALTEIKVHLSDWISEELGEDLVSSWLIIEPLREHAKRQILDSDRRLAEKVRAQQRRRRTSASGRLSARSSGQSPYFGYVEDPQGQSLAQYEGWLPMRSFDRDGQIYYVREELIEALREEFPHLDIPAQIEGIFHTLAQYPLKRPRISCANGLIRSWIARENERLVSEGSGKSSARMNEIEDAFQHA